MKRPSSLSRNAISVPSTSVRPTFTAVKSTERRTTRQNSPSREDRGEVLEADPLALVGDQLEEAVVLEREPDEEVDRVAEDRDDHDHAPARSARTGPRPRRAGPARDGDAAGAALRAAPAASRLQWLEAVRRIPASSRALVARVEDLVIWSLVALAACCTDCLPVRMFVSIVRRTFELSTFAQFFAVGTNQVSFADCGERRARACP